MALKPTLRLRSFGSRMASSATASCNNPSKNEVGLDVSHHTRVFPRGGEKLFFLDILFHRMSDMAILQQLTPDLTANHLISHLP